MPGFGFVAAARGGGLRTDLAAGFVLVVLAVVFFDDVVGLGVAFCVVGFFAVALLVGAGFFGAAAGRLAGGATVSGLWPAGCWP
jgi:hypothetical protein